MQSTDSTRGNGRLTPSPQTIFHRVLSLAAVRPAVQAALPALPWEPALVLGGGKAGRDMAAAVVQRFPNVRGALAVPREHAGTLGNLELLPAGHPLPDEGSIDAVHRQEYYLREIDGPCLFLLSGGASALLGAPAGAVSLDRLRELYDALLRSGLDIQAMNLIRRHCTRWGGGKFLRRAGRRDVHAMVVSDVLDDDLTVIGSGPTVADPSTLEETREYLQRLPGSFTELLVGTMMVEETVKPGDFVTRRAETQIALSNRTVVAMLAKELGAKVLEPQTAEVGQVAGTWAEVLAGAPGVYVAGGEPTVVIPPGLQGRGGRNQHLVAEITKRKPRGRWMFLSIATDGIDGNSGNAGAWVDSAKAEQADGVEQALRSFETAAWCEREGLAFKTGPTGTNVADIQIALVRPS